MRQQIARQGIVGLDEDIDRLERLADDAEAKPPAVGQSTLSHLNLPPEIAVPRPVAIVDYLGKFPEMVDLVRDMATALIEEFRGERSEIEFDAYQDPEIDDRYLTLIVRLPKYDDGFMDRLDSVVRQFDDRRRQTDGWVLATSDFEPIE